MSCLWAEADGLEASKRSRGGSGRPPVWLQPGEWTLERSSFDLDSLGPRRSRQIVWSLDGAGAG